MHLLITQPKYFEFNAVVENDFFVANLHKDNFVFVNLQIGVKMTYLLHIIKYALDEMLEGIFVLA